MKIGLAGCGQWGKNLVREFNNLNVLSHIFEINQKTVDQFKNIYPNITFTNNWDDIINNQEISAVCISLPAEYHYKYAKDALLNNKDVYVEKPITLNLEEAEELINLSHKNNKILMVGHILQYHPCIEKIKELIKNGEIGRIINIISNRLNLGTFRTFENVLWSFAPHDISVILSLCDDTLPDVLYCTGKDNLTKGIHDITNTVLEWKDKNIYVNINVNWLNPFKEQKLTIIGEKGMILFDDTLKEDKLKLFKDYIKWSDTIPIYPSPNKSDGIVIDCDYEKSPLYKECKHFIECCQERKTPITSGEEGLRVLKVLNYSTNSLHNDGKKIYLSDYHKEYFSHPTSIIDQGCLINKNAKIWHFTHVTKNAIIGENTSIGQNCYIDGLLGKNCKVQNNISVYNGVECSDNVFIGPSAVFTNDINPRCEYPKNGNYVKTIIKQGVSIGAGSVIRCGVTLNEYCFIGCGSVVVKDVPSYKIVVGNPAKVIGEIDKLGNRTIY